MANIFSPITPVINVKPNVSKTQFFDVDQHYPTFVLSNPSPTNVKFLVNGVIYFIPAFKLSGNQITWAGSFPLMPSDTVAVIYQGV